MKFKSITARHGITVNVAQPYHISFVAQECIQLANALNTVVRLTFNDVDLTIDKNDTWQAVVEKWDTTYKKLNPKENRFFICRKCGKVIDGRWCDDCGLSGGEPTSPPVVTKS